MGLLPMDRFLCWVLKVATLAVAVAVIVFGFFACIMEMLDIAAQADASYDIIGGFKARWRSHVWEGWLACNIVMVVCHLILVAYSVLMIFAIKQFPTYYEFNLTKGYLALLIMYILVELGTSLYKYSWYGPNTFRLAYLIFAFMFWIVRTIIYFVGCLVLYSRIKEVEYEIEYGEKKLIAPYMSPELLAEMRAEMMSGVDTPPVPFGMQRPGQSYA